MEPYIEVWSIIIIITSFKVETNVCNIFRTYKNLISLKRNEIKRDLIATHLIATTHPSNEASACPPHHSDNLYFQGTQILCNSSDLNHERRMWI